MYLFGYIDQAGPLTHRDPPASAARTLGLKAHTTYPWPSVFPFHRRGQDPEERDFTYGLDPVFPIWSPHILRSPMPQVSEIPLQYLQGFPPPHPSLRPALREGAVSSILGGSPHYLSLPHICRAEDWVWPCHNLGPGQRDKDTPRSERERQRPYEEAEQQQGLDTLYIKRKTM